MYNKLIVRKVFGLLALNPSLLPCGIEMKVMRLFDSITLALLRQSQRFLSIKIRLITIWKNAPLYGFVRYFLFRNTKKKSFIEWRNYKCIKCLFWRVWETILLGKFQRSKYAFKNEFNFQKKTKTVHIIRPTKPFFSATEENLDLE